MCGLIGLRGCAVRRAGERVLHVAKRGGEAASGQAEQPAVFLMQFVANS